MSALVVTIDTEEEGRWSAAYPPRGNTCRNVAELPRIHRLFAALGVVPTYLVDYPVVEDPGACDTLAGFAAGGGAEIGAHLHPWCNPPFADDSRRSAGRYTYPHNLPQSVQVDKLSRLCEAIERRFGRRPTSYRAGRWGFDHRSIPPLEQVGIRVDSSVTPLWWDRGDGGPAFPAAPLRPYRPDYRDACRPGRSGLVEVPMSTMVVSPLGAAIEGVVRKVGPAPGLRAMLVRLGLTSLRPEQYDADSMCRLADAIARRRVGVFNLMFHSSIALPGATPYVRDRADLDRFCGRLERVLEHILSRHGAVPVGLTAAPEHLNGSLAAGAIG